MPANQRKPERSTVIRRAHTRFLASFHTWPENGFDTSEVFEYHPEFGHIIGFQCQKSLGGASGTFSMTVKKPKSFGPNPLTELWKEPENVWVFVQTLADGVVMDTFLGLVDSVSDDMVRSGGGMRSETFTITGRDFGKVLETTEVFIDMFLGSFLRTMSAMTTVADSGLIGTPAHFVRLLYDLWVGNQGASERQWEIPPSLAKKFGVFESFYDMVHLAINEMTPDRDGLAIQTSIISPEANGQKLWDLMQAVSNGVMNELFVDLLPKPDRNGYTSYVPTLVFRERPFPAFSTDPNGKNKSVITRSLWDALPEIVLDAGDVMSRSLAKGGAAHRFNFWSLRPSNIQTFQLSAALTNPREGVKYGYPGNIPIVNYFSIKRHGLRRWEQATDYIPFYKENQKDQQISEVKEKSPEEWLRLVSDWTRKVHDWYCIAPMELSGTITTTRVMPEIRIGTRLGEIRPDGLYHYYVEAVSHSWMYPNAGQTTITVSRGEREDAHLLANYYLDTKFGSYATDATEPPQLAGIDPDTGEVDSAVTLDDLLVDPPKSVSPFTGAVTGPPILAGSAGGMIRPSGFGEPVPHTPSNVLDTHNPTFAPDDIDALLASRDEPLSQAQLEAGEPIALTEK